MLEAAHAGQIGVLWAGLAAERRDETVSFVPQKSEMQSYSKWLHVNDLNLSGCTALTSVSPSSLSPGVAITFCYSLQDQSPLTYSDF